MKWGWDRPGRRGAIAVVATHFSVDENTTTQDEFESLRLQNDLSWAALGLGAASVALSFVLTPALPEDGGAKKTSLSLELGPARMGVRLCY